MGMIQTNSPTTNTSRLRATATPTYGTTEPTAAATTESLAKVMAAAGGRSPSKLWTGVPTGAVVEGHSISPKRPSAPSRTRVWVSSLSPTRLLLRTRVTKSTRCRSASTNPYKFEPIAQGPCHKSVTNISALFPGHGMRVCST